MSCNLISTQYIFPILVQAPRVTDASMSKPLAFGAVAVGGVAVLLKKVGYPAPFDLGYGAITGTAWLIAPVALIAAAALVERFDIEPFSDFSAK